MSWTKRQMDFGVIKVDGRTVKVYETPSVYVNINTPENVLNASWAGDAVVVHLASGRVRRYTTQSIYTNI